MRSPLRVLLLALFLPLLAGPAGATWSLVVLNRRTGEVAVATATCLENFNIRVGVPVMRVGQGAAAAQSQLDQGAVNRRTISTELRMGATPQEILDLILAQDFQAQGRQYGIVSFTGGPVTFTGNQAGAAATGVTGTVGDYEYAIQGNVLAGNAVIFAAEEAFVRFNGDLTQKLMAAMEAARLYGGDGRCSCSGNMPTSCGSPPPSFAKSAHIAYVGVARIGDEDGFCNQTVGCASGTYFLGLNVLGNAMTEEPVFRLRRRYDLWRFERKDHPDGILSELLGGKPVPADGVFTRDIVLRLRDIEGDRITHGGATITVTPLGDNGSIATVGPVTDHGDGTYTFDLTAGTVAGLDRFQVQATDDFLTATLYPHLEIEHRAPAPLFLDTEELSAMRGGTLSFLVDDEDAAAAPFVMVTALRARPWKVLTVGFDPLAELISIPVGTPFWPGAPGRLGAAGRSRFDLEVPPGALTGLVGAELDWAGVVFADAGPRVTNVVRVDVRP